MAFERIVCGIDGSEESFGALRQSRRLLAPGGRLLAVAAVEERLAVHAGMQAGTALEQLRTEAEAARREADELLAGLDDAEAVVVSGRPVDVIRAAVEREQADLVAVGTHEKRRLPGILLGGVATEILHGVPCSVLVARAAEPATFPSAIVVGLDGSPESERAAAVAAELAEGFGASLRLLAASKGKGGADPDAVRRVAEEAEIDPGGALEALEAAAKEADLLVVGSRGLGGLRALGSVSERIAHRAGCSVLVVRQSGSAERDAAA